MATPEEKDKDDVGALSEDEKKALNSAIESTFKKVKYELKETWLKEGYSVVILLRPTPNGVQEITVNGRKMGSNPEEEFKSPCNLCGKAPCKVQRYMDCYCIFVKYYINEEHKDLPNNKKRKLIYRKLNEEVRGVRGKYNRKRFPRCVERLVRYHWSSKSGDYVGFKRVREGDEVVEGHSDDDMDEWSPTPEEFKEGKETDGDPE